MKKFAVASLAVLMGASVVSVQDTSVHAETVKEGTVTAYWLNVRTGPSPSNYAFTQLKKGTKVQVLSQSGGWAKVSVNGKTGYVYDSYLDIKTTNTATDTKTVTAYWLTVRTGPSANYKAIDYLKKGTKVDVIQYSGDWVKIKVNGKVGYVHGDYLGGGTNVASSTNETRYVSAYWLNMRSGPSANNSIVTTLKQGTKVSVTKYNGDWAYVTANGKTGYVHADYLTSKAPTVEDTKTESVVKYVTSSWLNLRSSASNKSSILGSYKKNTKVSVQSTNGDWSYVTVEGKKGYMHNGYLSSTATSNDSNVGGDNDTKPTNPSGTLKGKTIVIDPGHGGSRPGAHGHGIIEEDLTLDIALKVRDKLVAEGARVVMTRTSDTDCAPGASYSADLACRPGIANSIGADAFVSIHGNAYLESAYGVETFWYDSQDKQLANDLQNNYISNTGMHYRRVAQANFAVLRNSNVPASLIEVGFMTNPGDSAKLKQESFRYKAAEGIKDGLVDFFN